MKLKFEYKITLAYLVLGSLWILFSDKIVFYFIPDGFKLTTIQTIKGWFFVIATALLFFSFIKKHLTKSRLADKELKQKTEEYYSLYEEYKSQAEDLHEAKTRTEESLSHFKLLIENAPIPIFIQTEGRFAYVNKALCDLYGAGHENELIGTNVLDRAHPDCLEIIKKRIHSLNEKREHVPKSEYKHLKLNRDPIDVETMAVPFKYENKIGALVFLRDVTMQKRFENELIHAKERAEESNRLKTAFLNNISHEFRTPLNGMLGFLELTLKESVSIDQRKKYYQIIRDSSTQFLNILTDVVEISQIQSKSNNNKTAVCNIKEIIDYVIGDKKKQLNAKSLAFELQIECNKEELQIKTDPHKIERSLMHVLDNAIKFTHQGTISLSCKQRNNHVEISVKDTGIGISPDDQLKIFEPFRQVEMGESRSYGGNGIGLTLVKSYIESLGGKIKLKSEPKKGTNVVLTLPHREE